MLQSRARANELTLLAVLATVTMLFAAFTAAYLIRRTGSDWHRVSLPGLLWVNTLVLILSSFTLEAARRSHSRKWLTITLVLGFVFLAGQLLAWRTLAAGGIFLADYPHGSFIYMLSGVHGVHLLGGIAALAYARFHEDVFGLCGAYWHFVDIVWLYTLLLLCLL